MHTGTNQLPASVPERFAHIVARHGRRMAISAPGAKWTYAELAQRSHALAAIALDRLGAGSEPVALLMEHGGPLLAAILGVLQSGKIY
ncbi:MAG TPA: AMP-binding protein, partial [Candidatus Nitrosopolaris sp.]|nr:AMP-binding protein [Candidatus Nitrosopolaris sp.]